FKYVSSTADSAILEWSTTQAASGDLACNVAGETTAAVNQAWSSEELTNTVTATGLTAGTEYECVVSIGDITSEMVNFTTSTVIDEEPPELLNLAVEVLDDGRARISWYTSESSTESISLDGTVIHTDDFATKKNHEHITAILSDGDYTLVVTSADASDNSNASTIEFTVDVGASGNNGNTGNNNGGTNSPDSNDDNDEASSEISSTTLQIAVLGVVFLLIVAFIRVSKNDNDSDDKWS
ncbi:MAG: fibronectin type III domain-containing protein, partial [Candidatus Thermoplasmatota archaeon]|nr:fibronectin type III domain-containing protein [Candidatus Thermoplasmatota archaeon]